MRLHHKICSLLSRLFRRKMGSEAGSWRKPSAIDLYMRNDDSQVWKFMKRFQTMDEAEDASQIFAAEAVFSTGEVMFFQSKFEPVYGETVEQRETAGPYRP